MEQSGAFIFIWVIRYWLRWVLNRIFSSRSITQCCWIVNSYTDELGSDHQMSQKYCMEFGLCHEWRVKMQEIQPVWGVTPLAYQEVSVNFIRDCGTQLENET